MRLGNPSLTTGLIYAAVLVRAAAWYQDNPPPEGAVIWLLVVYGVLLFSEPLVTRRLAFYPYIYLTIQSGLNLFLMFSEPGMDFLPTLFFPLSFQAVKFFKRRLGFLWIGAFSLAMAGPLLIGWDWQLPGVASILIYSATNFLVGNFAHLIYRAEAGRQENQHLTAEMGAAFNQLQEYAARVEEYAAAQERGRLARELHDSVTQTLFSMNLTVQGARMLADKEPGRVAEQLERLQVLARGAAGEIQVLVSQLQPRPVIEGGLGAALRRLCSERERQDGLKVRLEITGGEDGNLPETVAVGLYRIAQEALNNIVKHAGTCEAAVRLNLECRPRLLEIEDSGLGFQPESLPRSLDHIGLAGMKDRARELGWTLKIDSQPGRGTRIHVEESPHDR